MKLRAAIISCVCLFLICSVSEATTKNWKVSKTIDISKKERVVFREVVPEEGAEWASTKGEILIEEVVSQNGQYKIKNYIVQNIPVVTRHYNAFISPDRTMLIFVKDKKLHSYDFASGKYQLLKEAHYVKQIPDFVKG